MKRPLVSVGMGFDKIKRFGEKVSEKHTGMFASLLHVPILFSCLTQLCDTDHFIKIRYGVNIELCRKSRT